VSLFDEHGYFSKKRISIRGGFAFVNDKRGIPIALYEKSKPLSFEQPQTFSFK